MVTPLSIPIGAGDVVTGLHYAPVSTSLETAVVLGHGAGVSQTHPFMTYFARGLAARGLDAATFNFLYMERGRRAPDSALKLEACFRAVIETVRARVPNASRRLVIGGKSMGGRIATQIVASDNAPKVNGLVLLGYPLHPPGRPDRLRAAHLPSINAPMLVIQGSRDKFGLPDELRPVLAGCRQARLCIVEGGDHSFKITGRERPTAEEVYDPLLQKIVEWIRGLRLQTDR